MALLLGDMVGDDDVLAVAVAAGTTKIENVLLFCSRHRLICFAL